MKNKENKDGAKTFSSIVTMARIFATGLGLTGTNHRKKVRELVEVALSDY